MVSAVDDLDTVLRCIKLGADDYVQKPFNADLLRARVEAALERKRLRDQERHVLEQLQQEKARVNELLHSILPKAIVTELKTDGRPQARRHDSVAVLFCDLVGFTEYCDEMHRNASCMSWKRCRGFESVVEAHGLEKIKTVGDASWRPRVASLRRKSRPQRRRMWARDGKRCHQPLRRLARSGPRISVRWWAVMGKRNFVFDVWGIRSTLPREWPRRRSRTPSSSPVRRGLF